jgi:hypothetical protein
MLENAFVASAGNRNHFGTKEDPGGALGIRLLMENKFSPQLLVAGFADFLGGKNSVRSRPST